uniref:IS30 family transposase n=1 Tax=Dethiobacter alkaliphilus TaxID=427926 RepID=UPI0037BF458A
MSDQLSSLGSKAYFCHPYSSWEKGANEKHNSLIRRFLPKGTSFADLTPESVARIQNWCNNLPRKILGYLTPLQAFHAERLAAA